MALGISPARFIEGDEAEIAVRSLRYYFAPGRYTGGWFEQMTDTNSPYEISPRDIVAVSALGVDVPISASQWLLNAGRAEISACLLAIPPEAKIWEGVDLSPTGEAWRLWGLVDGRPDVGPTITSKLLAAKRPHLFPIWDQHVIRGILPAPGEYWSGWRESLTGESGEMLREACESLRREAEVSDRISTLRLLDVVIWMRVHGYKSLPEEERARYEPPAALAFWTSP